MGYQNCAQQSADAVLNGSKRLLGLDAYVLHVSTINPLPVQEIICCDI